MEIAVLMKRVKLNENVYAFKLVKGIYGTIDSDGNLTTLDKNVYGEYTRLNDDDTLCYGYEEEVNDEVETKCAELYNKHKDDVAIGIYKSDKSVVFYDMPVSEFESKYLEEGTGSAIITIDELMSMALSDAQDKVEQFIKLGSVAACAKALEIYTNLQLFYNGKMLYNGVSLYDLQDSTYAKLVAVTANIYDKLYEKWPAYMQTYENSEMVDTVMDIIPEGTDVTDLVYHFDSALETKKSKKSTINPQKYTIDKIYKGITGVVLGQDEQVKRISVQLYKRLLQLTLPENKRSKFGMLVTGPTGVGKTEIFNTFSTIVDIPILKIDSTQLTKPGYVGKNIEDYLLEFYQKEKGNKERVESAIVLFDEIDKKASSAGSDVSGKAVQDVLLKFMDGTEYNIGNDKSGNPIIISTCNMTPICMGAFTDLYETKKKNPIGLTPSTDVAKNKDATVEDFYQYGMTKEFIGRLPIRVHLNNLNIDNLVEILKKSKKSPILYQKNIFKLADVKLVCDDNYIRKVAEKAYHLKSGARSLTGIVEDTTWLPMADISDNKDKYSKLTLTGDTVNDPKVYKLSLRRNNNAKTKGNI